MPKFGIMTKPYTGDEPTKIPEIYIILIKHNLCSIWFLSYNSCMTIDISSNLAFDPKQIFLANLSESGSKMLLQG